MKVAHLTGSVSSHGGGISLALCSLVNGQEKEGIETLILAPEDDGTDLPEWPPGQPLTVPARQLGPLRWGKNLGGQLTSADPDLIHTHGLWGQSSLVAGRFDSPGVGKVISPHGMLDPWALQNGRMRKWVAMKLFERRFLAAADCLHALCRSEAESIRALGLRNPVAIIPNGVDLPEKRESDQRKGENKILLFLGRLHPKKGLPNALRAFARSQADLEDSKERNTWQFVIAGWGQGGHDEELKQVCRELDLSYSSVPAAEWIANQEEKPVQGEASEVVFVGPVFGETKDDLLRRSDAFILPSFSEGLPVAVLEAWSYELPVVMTEHCNLPEGFEAKAALSIGTDVDSIARGMTDLFCSSDSKLRSLGGNGRSLVERQFTWSQIAEQMKELYEWILKSGRKPDFVEIASS